METNLDYALAYSKKGWPVFPLHTPTLNGCSCGNPKCHSIGKHPRTSNGFKSATTNETTIRNWWAVWPEANIGVATGSVSRLIVLDVDEGGEESLELGGYVPTNDTVQQITGSGGRHVFYQYPVDSFKYGSHTNVLPHVDIRSDGGYIVAPPSLHQSGNNYEWEASCDPFEGVQVAPLDEWLAGPLKEKAQGAESKPCYENGIDGVEGFISEEDRTMLDYIPSDDRDTWVKVGMAIHHENIKDGFDLWNKWASTSPKYNPKDSTRVWLSFGKYSSKPVAMATIRELATNNGWIDPSLEQGQVIIDSLLKSFERQNEEALKEASNITKGQVIDVPDIMPKEGLIKDIAEYILRRSIRPQRELAVMAATTFVGMLAGRNYMGHTGLRTNLYTIGLAKSGRGKEAAKGGITDLMHRADIMKHLGGSDIASGPGLLASLEKEPSKLFILDEFGLMLQSATGAKSDSHKAAIVALLLKLYSSASSVFNGTEYADQQKRACVSIVNPCACLYGMSTPEEFYRALGGAQGSNGTLARMLLIVPDEKRPDRQEVNLDPPNSWLIEQIKRLAKGPERVGNLSGVVTPDPHVVRTDERIKKALADLDDSVEEFMTSEAADSVYSRLAENTAKLALTYAVSIDPINPIVDIEAFTWGKEIAQWSVKNTMKAIVEHVADNETESNYKMILRKIKKAGSNGIKQSDLNRSTRSLRSKEIKEIVSDLVDGGDIESVLRESKMGRSALVYVATNKK